MNEKNRKIFVEETFHKEWQKFDHEMARRSWVGGLRDDSYMYVQTTKNPRNALHCFI